MGILLFLDILSIVNKLEKIDRDLFLLINNRLANPVLDTVFPFIREAVIWAPLYLFVIFFMTLNFGKQGWWWLLGFLVTVCLTDIVSSSIIKEHIMRLRPCNDPALADRVRVLVSYRPQSSSFTSSHAANHFGLATYFFLTCRKLFKKWAWLAFLWAGLISLAQIYVGVHYPFDVFCGTIVGLLGGIFTATIFNKRWGFATFGNQPTISS